MKYHIRYINSKYYVLLTDKKGNLYDTMHSFTDMVAALSFIKRDSKGVN